MSLKTQNAGNMSLCRVRITTVVLVAVFACLLCAAVARADLPAMTDVEKAVLAADVASGSLKDNWTPVVKLLADVKEETPDAVLRLIKGHACLAVNENNEAVCLFLSARSSEDQDAWLKWAEKFAAAHAGEPIAHYYHGDALARRGKLDDAVACFTDIVEKGKGGKHALSFNARGVAYARLAELDPALCDFDTAARLEAAFADSHANCGDLFVQKRTGSRGAMEAYNRALKHSPDFALALMGRAYIYLVLPKTTLPEQSQRAAARKDLERALAKSGCLRGELEDSIKAAAFRFGADSVPLDLLTDARLGTEFSKQFQQLLTADKQFRAEPTDKTATALAETLTHFGKTDPELYHKTITQLQFGWKDDALKQRALATLSNAAAQYADLGPQHKNNSGQWDQRNFSVDILKAGAGVGYSQPYKFDFREDVRQGNFDTVSRMMKTMDQSFSSGIRDGGSYVPRMPEQRYDFGNGGVAGSLSHMVAEDGQWEFRSIYGLYYPCSVKDDHTQSKGMAE